MPIIDASKLSATVEFKFEGADSMTLESYLQQAKVWTARKKLLFNFELSRLTVNFRDGLAKVSIFLERLQIRPSWFTRRSVSLSRVMQFENKSTVCESV